MIDTPLTTRLGKIAPPRFMLFCAALAIGLAVLIPMLDLARATMAAFDIASALFLAVVAPLLDSKPDAMRAHASNNDANRALLLAISVVVTLVILASVASEMPGMTSPVTVALVVVTLVLAWLFSNTIWALHYANLFYAHDDAKKDGGKDEIRDRGGLNFPGCDEPNYWDFAYFSFVIGTAFAVSDIRVESRHIRRVVLLHSVTAFYFNIAVVALTISLISAALA